MLRYVGYSRAIDAPEISGQEFVKSVRLPQEIIDMIANEVDLPSAYQCALVASCFVHPVRRRIFHSIRLSESECHHVVSGGISGCLADFLGLPRKADIRPAPSRSLRLVEILDSAPELGALVKELTIEGNSSKDALCPISSWYCHRQAPLPTILSRLPNLEQLSLLFPSTRPLFFRCLPIDSAVAIVQAAQSPNLRRIVLENVLFDNKTVQLGDLFEFISVCASGGCLSEISISDHFTSGTTRHLLGPSLGAPFPFTDVDAGGFDWCLKDLINATDIKPAHNTTISLSSLSIYGTDYLTRTVLDWAVGVDSPVSLDSLQSLALGGVSRSSVLYASQVIQSCSKTLERLAFSQEASYFSPCPSMSPPLTSELLHVKDLRFVDNCWDERLSSPTLYQWCAILESSAPQHLTTFTADIHWHLDSIERGDRFRSVSWHRLESALSRVSPRAKLCVNVAITVSDSDAQSITRWKKVLGPDSGTLLAECFPKSHRKGDGFAFAVTVSVASTPSRLRRPAFGYEYTPAQGWAQLQ
ncbi:hypothetical protein E1B28_000226 [Marasmius oreades]|uniref:Uncharacterized protein n=1 Tax=Marasmius oreades TaxID=181124 RepID=A0A9P8AE45_9AGAR|nr:uncharacterized protein E1B28_000226 [Marasmius oreades]KAG7098264.1 hypothetical protein E1B28_000226 [Marasmius oreades]